MPALGFLGQVIGVIFLAVGLLSGALSIIREVQLMYRPAAADRKRVFWAFVRIAFVISAVILLANEHSKVRSLQAGLSKKEAPIIVNVPPAQIIATAGQTRRPKPYVSMISIVMGYFAFSTSPFRLQVTIRNGSQEVTAENIVGSAELVQAPSGAESEEKEFEGFLGRFRKVTLTPRNLGPGQEYPISTNDLLLSPDGWQAVRDGTKPVYLFAAVRYAGDKEPVSETCWYYSGQYIVAGDISSLRHDCLRHNR
jgi:hypothetical protein